MASAAKLFLLEVLIYKIQLHRDFENIPKRDEIAINIRFSEIINSSLIAEDFKIPGGEMNEGLISSLLTVNLGKTCLFLVKPKDLVTELKQSPLELGFQINRQTIATAFVPFKSEFGEMVNIYDSIGIVKSVEFSGISDLKTVSDETIGTIDIFLRMTCFGDSIDTDFRWFELTNEYVFMEPKSAVTFKLERFDLMNPNNITPITSIYNPAICTPISMTNKRLSWTELFGGGKTPGMKLSVAPIGLEECPLHMDISRRQSKLQHTFSISSSAYDIVSMVFRPPENKFFDFLNMVSAEVTTREDETMVTLSVSRENVNKKQLHIQDEIISYDVEKLKNIIGMDDDEEEDLGLELTADKIARKLCGHKDCPAAKKFKEYGIGPLATGKGLGTLYGNVEPPMTYGLSHTYGTFANYGPYGLFSRPKSPDQQFIPPKNALDPPRPPCPRRKGKTCGHAARRLRGGGSPRDALDSSLTPSSHTLRLRGGGPLETDSFQGPKSPFLECKPVMDKFDQILAAYKKALGPCGQPTCPYTQNVADANCEKFRKMTGAGPAKKDADDNTDSVSCQSVPCDMAECPYRENKNRFPAGCGSPKCAYAAYKLGLVDDDAALELQFLPPAVSGKCGHPKCEYPLKPDLPPIHWDCPDPLPKGNCKNLNCPFMPPDLKVMKCLIPKKGPCGSTDCPYALPPPCNLPNCPFRQKPCPFLEQQQRGDQASCSITSKNSEICENPDCPFANNGDDQSACFQEDNIKGEFQTCANPDCPFAKKSNNGRGDDNCANVRCPSKGETARKSKKKPTSTNCDNPDCPFANSKKKVAKKSSSVCENPDCPFAVTKKKTVKKSSSVCENPDCPFAKKTSDKIRGSICGNPDCAFAQYPDSPSANTSENSTQSNICTNPDCPFAKKSGKNTTSSSEKCSKESADCEGSSVCSNPNCPYTSIKADPICNDPFCPYLQPLPSCGIPNCPYEPVPVVFCPSPNCPAKSKSDPRQPKKLSEQRQRGRNSCNEESEEIVIAGDTEMVVETTTSVIRKSKEQSCTEQSPAAKENVSGNGNGKKKRGKFVYSIGDKYPGVKIGHRECVMPMFNVPPKMGWLWNIHNPVLRLKPRKGWKPGAIVKTIAQRIRAHRQLKGLGMQHVPKFRKLEGSQSDPEINVSPKPTLHIQKKDGAYWITMNPLKDPKTLAENEDPYMECTPMQFKITKSKNKPKDDNDEDGSRLCCCEPEGESSSSDSELDIEFTPPAGIIHPERFKKKKNVVHCDTQYSPDDFEVKKDAKKGKSETGEKKKGKGKDKEKGKKGKK